MTSAHLLTAFRVYVVISVIKRYYFRKQIHNIDIEKKCTENAVKRLVFGVFIKTVKVAYQKPREDNDSSIQRYVFSVNSQTVFVIFEDHCERGQYDEKKVHER